MSGLKTLLVLLIVVPVSGWAMDRSLIATFASCAGRYSAELEHAWLMSNENSEEIAIDYHQFVDLLGAAVPPDQRKNALNLRIHAKLAHSRLLSHATFTNDEEQARWAVRRARSEIAYCQSFLLKTAS